ncbi:AAA family ATPase [Paraclostridium sordellii]|uniref:AAA family ATPase n=1 Tax=Paraclostridium sordellii TaxID=1505 RepID=UPI00096A90A9|nr:AAA family ATPase [Paeniclostridium sordellii]
MIKNINYIKKLGIYKDYNNTGYLDDFKKFNLFYGWNGCGKSTLAKLFRTLEKKSCASLHQNAEFSIEMMDGSKVTNNTLDNFNDKVFIYNQDFIKENIDWDGTAKSILILSRESIEKTKSLNEFKDSLYGDKSKDIKGLYNKKSENEKKIDEIDNKLEKNLSNIASDIKEKFIDLNSKEKYYIFYDKKKLKNLIQQHRELLCSMSLYINYDEKRNLEDIIKSGEKERIQINLNKIEIDKIESILNKINNVLNTTVTAKVIDRLKPNKEISVWVENGLKLHKNLNLSHCEFCGSELDNKRIDDLEQHFNDELRVLKSSIEDIKRNIESNLISEEKYRIDCTELYLEEREKVEEINQFILTKIHELNDKYKGLISLLEYKKDSPFEKIPMDIPNIKEDINAINNKHIELEDIVAKHNEQVNNINNTIKNALKKLEIFYAQKSLMDRNYFTDERLLGQLKETSIIYKNNIESLEKEMKSIESELSNEVVAAEDFNKKLSLFLGHDEIKLKFNNDIKGYEIIRYPSEDIAKNLSEGEKTAISFIYYITKLTENGNKIEDSILVIDDPISSFDSNKLFNSYAYLKLECEKSKQLFILTHNYNYFKLVRGWIKNKKIKNSKGKHQPNFNIYKIEPKIMNNTREGFIHNGGNMLNQTTEYDYIFGQVYNYYINGIQEEEIYACGNICRKLVESFLSFKFPSQRSNLEQLLEQAFKGENSITKDSIYRFINMYSHKLTIEVDDELDDDILISESSNIINEIIEMIKRLDSNHYESMVKIVKKDME